MAAQARTPAFDGRLGFADAAAAGFTLDHPWLRNRGREVATRPFGSGYGAPEVAGGG